MREYSRAQRTTIVAALGTSQTIAWASSYYIAAILADSMARDMAVSTTNVFAAFSAALLISALLGPRAGKMIDRYGGREVLAVSNLIFAAGLCIMAAAQSVTVFWLGWFVVGAAMGFGLYDAAFATLGRIFGSAARSPITGITLIAGFASTVGWPLTAWGEATIGWRGTLVAWALAHLVMALPLNLILPGFRKETSAVELSHPASVSMDRVMWLLGYAFAIGWMVSTALAAHLPRLLEEAGASPVEAVAAAALVGPAQVVARIAEAFLLTRYHPLLSARLSTLMHPTGTMLVLFGGGIFIMPFAFLHGAGNGIQTIARGTVPLAIYGPENYGYRMGLLGTPSRIAQAGAPLAFGVLIEVAGANSLVYTSLLYLSGFMALMLVKTGMKQTAG